MTDKTKRAWQISVETAFATDPRDWSINATDAWLWGIVLGWDRGAMVEVAARHRWSAEDVTRLHALHAAYRSHNER